MVFWVKRIAIILGMGAFFATLFISLDLSRMDESSMLVSALVKSGIAASLFWFAGLIVADVFVKGVVNDIPPDQSNRLEGGLLQHIYNQQLKDDPYNTNVLKLPIEVSDNEKKPVPKKKGKKRSSV